MRSYSVFLLPSDELGWGELRAALGKLGDVRIVGEAASLAEARRLAPGLAPDVIIAAATVEGAATIPLLGGLRRQFWPASKIVVCAARYEPEQLRAPVDAGIAGYLLFGDLSRPVLHHALAAVIAGDIILASRAVAGTCFAAPRGPGDTRLAAAGISARERAIPGWLAAGLSREQIAEAEGISATTVKRRIAALQKKLGAPDLFRLGMKAAQLGLVR